MEFFIQVSHYNFNNGFHSYCLYAFKNNKKLIIVIGLLHKLVTMYAVGVTII